MYNFIRIRKNKFEEKDYLLDERFIRYLNLIERNNKSDDYKAQIAVMFIKTIVEHLNYEEAIQAIETEHYAQDNSSIEKIYSEIEWKLGLSYDIITIEKEHKYDEKIYKNAKLLNYLKMGLHINKLPILLSPWSGLSVIGSFININDENQFDGVRFSHNIQNHYLYPMNIVVCNNGNHSQFAARCKNNGTTIINEVRDFTALYSRVKFDGNNYINTNDNTVIKLEYNKNILFYSGVIFELGRYLINGNYHKL